MISLGKLLVKRPENLLKHVQFLLSGISSTAVETDHRSVFQEQVGTIAAQVAEPSEDEAISDQLKSAVRLLDQYNRSAEHRTQAQQRELRGIIAATTQTIAAISSSSKSGIEQMRSLENSLEGAAKVDDLRLLRHKLFACLTLVRNETMRMQMDSQMMIRSLSASVLRASSELTPGTDSTTGLPGVAMLQRDVDSAAETGESACLAIIVLTDLAVINTRFGREGGDEVLRLTTDYIRDTFSGLAQLYRGHGPSLVLVCKGAKVEFDDFEQRAREVSRYPFQTSILVEGKLKNINVALSGMHQRLLADEKMEDVFRKFEAFASRELEHV